MPITHKPHVSKMSSNQLTPYLAQINELRNASSDVESPLNERSVTLFQEFLACAERPVNEATLTLDDTGMLHPIWVSEDRQTRLTIQMRSRDDLEYAWLPSDGSVEVKTVSISEFWTSCAAKMADVLYE